MWGARRCVVSCSSGRTAACGPYCESHTDALLRILKPTYTGGGAAYRIDAAALTT